MYPLITVSKRKPINTARRISCTGISFKAAAFVIMSDILKAKKKRMPAMYVINKKARGRGIFVIRNGKAGYSLNGSDHL